VNNCNELGRAARVEAQKHARLVKLGSEMRVQLSKRGKELRQEKKASAVFCVLCSVLQVNQCAVGGSVLCSVLVLQVNQEYPGTVQLVAVFCVLC
jgi:hypothetical protein